MQFAEYFQNLKIHTRRGRGISLFNCDISFYNYFVDKLKQLDNFCFTIRSSTIIEKNKLPEIDLDNIRHFIIYQNTSIQNIKKFIEPLINKIIYPLFIRYTPISLFSTLDQTKYLANIRSSKIHSDIQDIINDLLIEQFFNLLNHANFLFSTPEFIDKPLDGYIYTPIEKIMKSALDESDISYTPQVKIGRFYVDFLINLNGKKIIVECDGRDYHNPFHDKERDKELSKNGYDILHFTGSEIFHDIESCIEKIRNTPRIEHDNLYHSIDRRLLNDKTQKAAMEHLAGPARVLAPAGSGKTLTLINRIIFLINNGIDPNSILALAFNRKAAQEMRDRLSGIIPVTKKINEDGVTITTFHGFGYEVIREVYKWNFDGKTIKKETKKLLRRAVEPFYKLQFRRNKDPLDVFMEALRKTKMELPYLGDVLIEDENKTVAFSNIFNKYLELQYKHNFMNYDDMIYLALRILLDDEIVRKELQNKFQYVLIDEFQDLNKAQILLMQTLALPQNNLFIVGDDDQMIYGWRGAEVKHLLEFNKRYSESKDYILETNYRSSKRIVYHSKWLIDNNKNRVYKDIKPKSDANTGIFDIVLSESLYKQAQQAVQWIKEQKIENKLDWKDFAVLFRYHAYQFIVAMVLDAEKIPHSPVNQNRLFQTRVGRDIYSYLTIIFLESDASKEDYDRVLKRPNKYLKNNLIEQISSVSDIDKMANNNSLKIWEREKLRSFFNSIIKIRNEALNTLSTTQSIISAISNEFLLKMFYGERTELNSELDEAGDDIILDVILTSARYFNRIEDFHAHISKSLSDDIDDSDILEEEIKNKVTLSTIHKTKGNEYNNVVYFNMAHNNMIKDASEVEEERRVSYVGVTRAIKNILITSNKDKFSQYLEEAAFNPKLKEYSTIQLNNFLSKHKRDANVIRVKILHFKERKEKILKKFPELTGNPPDFSTRFTLTLMNWIREKRIDSATKKVGNIEEKITNFKQKLLINNDTIEKLKDEIKFRNLLLIKN